MEEKFGISTKKYMLAELKEKFSASTNLIIANHKGLGAQELDKLRSELLKSSSKYFVVKNSIAKRVFSELNLKELGESVKGEVGIGFVGDLIGASKTFAGFSKEHSSLKLNSAFIDGKVEGGNRIKHLAALPPREVLLGLVLSYMKGPITGFVGVLKGLLRNLVHAIDEIKSKKEGGEKK